jgi:hypothetical protein
VLSTSGVIPASAAGSELTVTGKFVTFRVSTAKFAVLDYTLTGAPNPEDITGGRPTVVFASKTPNLQGTALTSNIAVDNVAGELNLSRSGPGVSVKIQALDCATGGIFQMEPERVDGGTTDVTHILGPGVFYFNNPNFSNPPPLPLCVAPDFNPGCFPVPVTPRVNFANDVSRNFVGRDSPQVATKIFQSGNASVWRISSGGRVGGVMGEDSVEVAPPSQPCTHKCQARDRVRGRFPVLGFPFPVPADARIPFALP